MSKPGEMIQILRENYEEQLEAYRLLRNKFLMAVPGMNLDKEKQLYDQWKLDLHLNSIISFDRALPPEPRTCTEERELGFLVKMWAYANKIILGPHSALDLANRLAKYTQSKPAQRTCEHDWWTVSDADWAIRGARCHKCGEFVGGSIEQLADKLKPRTCATCGTFMLCGKNDPNTCGRYIPDSPQYADVETVREALDHGVAVYENLVKIGVYGSGKVLDLFKSGLAALDRIAGTLRG